MKKQLIIALALAAGASALHAQTFNAAAGYSASKLFDSVAGTTVSAVGADGTGNVFTIEGAFGSTTVLYRRSASDGYATAIPFYTFSGSVFGSFIRIRGGTVYFGESSTGAVYAKDVIDTNPATATFVGTIAGNYDLKFDGATAYVSYNPGGNSPEAKVAILDLATGLLDVILDTGNGGSGDFSGPIAFDSRGALYYGATTFGNNPGAAGGLFQFDAGEVSGAAGPTALSLPGTAFIANGSNQFLDLDGGEGLFQSNSPGFGPATVSLYDLGTLAANAVGSSADNEFFGGISYAGGTLFTALTDSTFSASSVFGIVPEPSATLLLTFGLSFLLSRRRRV